VIRLSTGLIFKKNLAHLSKVPLKSSGDDDANQNWPLIVEEVHSGDWGIGGKSLTTADVKALAAGKPTG
jgi:4-oxalocrotonate tautomerase